MTSRSRLALVLGAVCLALGSLSAQDRFVELTGSDANDGSQSKPWRTVTHAAAASPSGATIHIGCGTFGTTGFVEGIEINGGKKLTFVGCGKGLTVIQANAAFNRVVPYRASTRRWWAVFLIHGVGTTVNLIDMTLDAMHLETGVSMLTTALYSDGAGGTVERVEMRNAGALTPNLVQGRVGLIAIGKSTTNPTSLRVNDCDVHGWNKAGIVLGGDGMTGSITGCRIRGSGAVGQGQAAQVGIQLGTGGDGFTVRNNVIRDIWYTPSSWTAGGVVVYDTKGPRTNTIADNRFMTCEAAYYHYTPSGGKTRFANNRTANCGWGANVWSDGGSATNNVFDSEFGIWVNSSVSSFPMSGNSYSDFRANAGYPTKYVADGNSLIQDTQPDTSCHGWEKGVDTNLVVGTRPADMVVADFNGDGKNDFATANPNNNTVSVRFGSGGTQFGLLFPFVFVVPGGPSHIAIGEFSGTTGIDLAVLCRDGNVYIMTNNGRGAFTRGTPFDIDGSANNSSPTALAAAQLDAQGEDDLLVGWSGNGMSVGGGVRLLLVNSSKITAGTALPGTVRSARGIAIGDFDQNGRFDFGVVDRSTALGTSDKLQVYLQSTTNGVFQKPTSYPIGKTGTGIAVGFLDSDFVLDVAVTDAGTEFGEVYLFLGNKNGTFKAAPPSPVRVPAGATRVAMLDLQGDHDPDTFRWDLAVLHPSVDRVTTLMGYSDSGFEDAAGCATGLTPSQFAFGDLTGDGLPDMLVSNAGDDKVTVSLAKPLALSQVYGAGCPGTDLKIPEIKTLGIPPIPELGNLSFAIGLGTAKPQAIAVLLLAPQPAAALGPCLPMTQNIVYTAATLTDAFGQGALGLPVPNLPQLAAINLYYQWVVVDPNGKFFNFAALSNGLRIRTGF